MTPLKLPGAEPYAYKQVGNVTLLLHVVKPAGWSARDRRPFLLAFFAGGFLTGTPVKSLPFAQRAAALG